MDGAPINLEDGVASVPDIRLAETVGVPESVSFVIGGIFRAFEKLNDNVTVSVG